MTNLIETFLAADFTTLPAIMADATRSRPERKIAQAVYFHILSVETAALHFAKADALIAQINSWHVGEKGVTLRTRADFVATTMGRTDIRRALEDGVSEEAQAAEWMALARKVEANPAAFEIAA